MSVENTNGETDMNEERTVLAQREGCTLTRITNEETTYYTVGTTAHARVYDWATEAYGALQAATR